MSKRCRRIALATTVALGVLLGSTALPSAAGGMPSLRISRNKDGPYGEIASANLGSVGDKHVFHLKAKNKNGGNESALLQEPVGPNSSYSSKYIRNGNNITDDVQTIGYSFNIDAQAKRFKVRVKVTTGPPAPDCFDITLKSGTAQSTATVRLNGEACGI
jgi:hypothetical protein